MPIIDSLLPEFDREMAVTRRLIERLPEDRFGWRPHPKSWTLAELSSHVVNIPSWTVETVNRAELDIAPPGQPPMKNEPVKSRQAALEQFDSNVIAGRAALAGASDETMQAPWSLLAGGNKIFTLPRTFVMRQFVMSHLIHHRAQLGVYLRLCDVPVPSMYGPSADENPFAS